jgi:hypothetical protein
MEIPINPFAGTSFHDMWYLKRKAPNGRTAHLIDPITLSALCGYLHCQWMFVSEEKKLSVCVRCRGVAAQASLLEEIDNEHLK